MWRLLLLLSLLSVVLLSRFSKAAQLANVTLDDTDPRIQYAIATSWRISSDACVPCLNPPNSAAFNGTWHDGTHIVPNTDEDDEPKAPGQSDTDGDAPATTVPPPPPTSTSSTSRSIPTSSTAAPKTGDDDGDGGDDGDENSGKDHSKRSTGIFSGRVSGSPKRYLAKRDGSNQFEDPKLDSDDSGFVDFPVTAAFNFTGTAVYIFAILPLFAAPINSSPTAVNLTFMLDNANAGTFQYNGTSLSHFTSSPNPNVSSIDPSLLYQGNALVFDKADLENTPHSLVINTGPNSVFLFDRAVYTVNSTESDDTLPSSTSSGVRSAQTASQSARDSSSTNHNVVTFGGAIGGSVGFLALLAFGLGVSICYRRRRSARRVHHAEAVAYAQRFTDRDHGVDEALEADEGGDTDSIRSSYSSLHPNRILRVLLGQPPMRQVEPTPFVPRFFPGTMPASPPPYPADRLVLDRGETPPPPPSPPLLPPLASVPGMGIMSGYPLHRTFTGSYSYADRPPPSPPPDVEVHDPPMFTAVPPLSLSGETEMSTATAAPVSIISALATLLPRSATQPLMTAFEHMSATNSRTASLRSSRSRSSLDADPNPASPNAPPGAEIRPLLKSDVTPYPALLSQTLSSSTSLIEGSDVPPLSFTDESDRLSITSGRSNRRNNSDPLPESRR